MKNAGQILELLKKKKELFSSYESNTSELLACSIEDGEACIEAREIIIKKIDEINAEIKNKLADEPQKELVENVIKNKTSAADLPEEMAAIFEISQQIFSIMSRVRRMEGQALANMQEQKEEILLKIKQNNQSGAAQISKYFTGYSAGLGQNSYGGFGKA